METMGWRKGTGIGAKRVVTVNDEKKVVRPPDPPLVAPLKVNAFGYHRNYRIENKYIWFGLSR